MQVRDDGGRECTCVQVRDDGGGSVHVHVLFVCMYTCVSRLKVH